MTEDSKPLPRSCSGLGPVAAAISAALVAGCPGPPAPVAGQSGPAPAGSVKARGGQRPFDSLKEGLTAKQVRELVGEPAEIRPFKAGELNSNVWVYHRVVAEYIAEMPMGTREVMQADPLTGRLTTVQEPIYDYRPVTVSETIELLVIEDQLIKWKRKTERKIK